MSFASEGSQCRLLTKRVSSMLVRYTSIAYLSGARQRYKDQNMQDLSVSYGLVELLPIKMSSFVLKTIVIFVVTVHRLAGQAQASSLVRAVQCSLVRAAVS